MKNILIIAGSDNMGGAGAQADIKTCEAFGCYSATAITAFVCENTKEIYEIKVLDKIFLDAQIKGITKELQIDAIKVGMLFNEELIECTSYWLAKFKNIPIVIDPVCISKSNIKLIENDAIMALKELLKFATVATPNRYEAKALFGDDFSKLPCDVIVKRQINDNFSTDVLYRTDGSSKVYNFKLASPNIMHGAGCTFSSAIACMLAQGFCLDEAIKKAKSYIYNAINQGLSNKFGKTLLNHKVKP